MTSFADGILKITVFMVAVFCIITALPRLSPVLFPDVPEPTPTFDCDDGTLHMYRHFRSLGGSRYELKLKTDEILPVSRARYKEIKPLIP